jgi:integrase family protein with SAM-like domain
VQDIGPLDVRDYVEAAKANGLSTATLKQHIAAIRMLFDHLVTGGVFEHNPALSVKAPRQKLGEGKTPVLTAEEAGELLRFIDTGTVVGLRDRALIGVMVRRNSDPARPRPALLIFVVDAEGKPLFVRRSRRRQMREHHEPRCLGQEHAGSDGRI